MKLWGTIQKKGINYIYLLKWRRHRHTDSQSTVKIGHRSQISSKPLRREWQGIPRPKGQAMWSFNNLQRCQAGRQGESEMAWEILLSNTVKPQQTSKQQRWFRKRRSLSRKKGLEAVGQQERRAWSCSGRSTRSNPALSSRAVLPGSGECVASLAKLNYTQSSSRMELIIWVRKEICPSFKHHWIHSFNQYGLSSPEAAGVQQNPKPETWLSGCIQPSLGRQWWQK